MNDERRAAVKSASDILHAVLSVEEGMAIKLRHGSEKPGNTAEYQKRMGKNADTSEAAILAIKTALALLEEGSIVEAIEALEHAVSKEQKPAQQPARIGLGKKKWSSPGSSNRPEDY